MIANENAIETLGVFFNSTTADAIVKNYGHASIITANHVLAHTDDPHEIIRGAAKLLAKDGVFIFEVQYLANLIKHNQFDLTYHEHVCYFSLSPLIRLLEQHGLEIFDVEHINREGGSLRIYAAHTPSIFPMSENVAALLLEEEAAGLHKPITYEQFSKTPVQIKHDLLKLLYSIKQEGKKIAGYGAPAKGNTLLQYCGITSELLDYVTDTTPTKQGKYTPGSHIPIVSPERLLSERPDYILLLAWNFTDSILEKEKHLLAQGVQFIKPIPNVIILKEKS